MMPNSGVHYTDAELYARQAERNYRNCRAMAAHYTRLARAWRTLALQTRHHLDLDEQWAIGESEMSDDGDERGR